MHTSPTVEERTSGSDCCRHHCSAHQSHPALCTLPHNAAPDSPLPAPGTHMVGRPRAISFTVTPVTYGQIGDDSGHFWVLSSGFSARLGGICVDCPTKSQDSLRFCHKKQRRRKRNTFRKFITQKAVFRCGRTDRQTDGSLSALRAGNLVFSAHQNTRTIS